MLVAQGGLHAASMERIAAVQVSAKPRLITTSAAARSSGRPCAARVREDRAARQADIDSMQDHYSQLTRCTRTYLREIGERGGLLQTLLSSPDVRSTLSKEHREQADGPRSHAQGLVELYGVSRSLALGCTVVRALCLRAGKLIADKHIALAAGEQLCLSMVVRGSRTLIAAGQSSVRGTQGLEALKISEWQTCRATPGSSSSWKPSAPIPPESTSSSAPPPAPAFAVSAATCLASRASRSQHAIRTARQPLICASAHVRSSTRICSSGPAAPTCSKSSIATAPRPVPDRALATQCPAPSTAAPSARDRARR